MLDYTKLFEGISEEIPPQDVSALSSIKEEKESRDDPYSNKGVKFTNSMNKNESGKVSFMISEPNSPEKKQKDIKDENPPLKRKKTGPIVDSQDYALEEGNSVSSADQKSSQGNDSQEQKKSLNDKISSHSESKEHTIENNDSDSIDKDEILEIAETVFGKIADKMKEQGYTLQSLYGSNIQNQYFQGENVEILLQSDFLESFNTIGLTDLTDIEQKWIVQVVRQPDLDDNIIYSDVVTILENFGVELF